MAEGVRFGEAGANLVASQIEKWKDRASRPDEAEVGAWEAEQAAAEPRLREALDAILGRLGVIPQVRAGLPERD